MKITLVFSPEINTYMSDKINLWKGTIIKKKQGKRLVG